MTKTNQTREGDLLNTGLIRKTTMPDIYLVASCMRKEDKASIKAYSNRTAKAALLSITDKHRETCYTLVSPEGEPICIFGLQPHKDLLKGSIFAFFTDNVNSHCQQILDRAPSVFAYFHSIKRVLTVNVDKRNERDLRLIKKLGGILKGQKHGKDKSIALYQFIIPQEKVARHNATTEKKAFSWTEQGVYMVKLEYHKDHAKATIKSPSGVTRALKCEGDGGEAPIAALAGIIHKEGCSNIRIHVVTNLQWMLQIIEQTAREGSLICKTNGDPLSNAEAWGFLFEEAQEKGVVLSAGQTEELQFIPQQNVNLTPREADILKLLGQGLDNKDIAQSLGSKVGTICVHLTNTFRKLGVTNRTQAALKAHELGFIKEDPSMRGQPKLTHEALSNPKDDDDKDLEESLSAIAQEYPQSTCNLYLRHSGNKTIASLEAPSGATVGLTREGTAGAAPLAALLAFLAKDQCRNLTLCVTTNM